MSGDEDVKNRGHHVPVYRVGMRAWYIELGVWYLVEIIRPSRPRYIAIRSISGWDAERRTEWKYGEIEFPATKRNRLYARLRPLSARRV